MHQLVGYHRPTAVAEAVRLLAEPNRIVLAGGTTLRHDGGAEPVEVVDLQALGLDSIEADGPLVHVGATVTLQALVDNDAVPDLVRRTARAELPSTLRSLATVGGTIGSAESDSLLLAALLVHDATVHFADEGSALLGNVLDARLGATDLIVGVTVQAVGATAIAVTARTPADRPIVAAVGRADDRSVRLALCGIAVTPRLVDPAEVDALEPPGDFRGSPEYRRHLARALSARVLEELT
jgi:CO/xanthine dehydrogenase FAD-binding subunit